MSATNSTPTINLPLFIGTDKPAWLTDWNGSMNAIDSAIATLQTAEGGTATALASLSQSVTALSGTVEQHTTAIQTVTTATATNTGSINTITSLIGNGEPTTEDKTIIGAINEIYAEIGGGTGVEASDVVYSNTSSGLTATNVQAAIDEVNAKIPQSGNVDADDVAYDNTASGLTATNVQNAIDANCVLSTSEKAVGKDVDGKTIYEKTYASSTSVSADTVIDATMTTAYIDNLISMDDMVLDTTGYKPGYQVYSGGQSYVANFIVTSSGLKIQITNETISKYHLTIRYTKA